MPGYVPYMYKYAVVDIKPTYNHYIFIPEARLHSPKISFGGKQWLGQTSDGGGRALLP